MVPRGVFRLRVLTEWRRYDALYDDKLTGSRSTRSLGSSLASEALGVQQFPALAITQSALRALTGDATTSLSLGAFTTSANARVVVAPIMLEYGLTDRLSIGVNVPYVQTRTTLIVELNRAPGGGNVGVNTGFTTTSTQVFNDFLAASARITQALASCTTNPTQAICARQAEAAALHDATLSFAEAVGVLYGTASIGGQPFVPRTGALLDAINQHRTALNAEYASLGLGTIGTTALLGSDVTVALNELQAFLRDQGMTTRRDSLGTIDRLSIGDVELSAAYRLFDHLPDSARARAGGGVRSRGMVQGLVRFPTALPQLTGLPGEILTGGRFDVEGRGAFDIRFSRRLAASVSAQFTQPLGDRSVLFVANPFDPYGAPTNQTGRWKPTNVLAVTASPRLTFGGFFSVDADYAFIRRGGESYTFASSDSSLSIEPSFGTGFAREGSLEHRLGFGVSYSSVAQYERGRMPIPIEMSFVHLETMGASGNVVPKMFSDQVQVRIYYRR